MEKPKKYQRKKTKRKKKRKIQIARALEDKPKP